MKLTRGAVCVDYQATLQVLISVSSFPDCYTQKRLMGVEILYSWRRGKSIKESSSREQEKV